MPGSYHEWRGPNQPFPATARNRPRLSATTLGRMKSRLVLLAVLMFAASCASPVTKNRGLLSIPPDFGPVAWTTSPAAVVQGRLKGTAVVWIGRVVAFTYAHRDGKLVLEWVCNSLPFVAPGPTAIRERPVAVRAQSNGRFLVNLVEVDMPDERAEALKRDYSAEPHYLLAAGTVDSIVDDDGIPTVFLYT